MNEEKTLDYFEEQFYKLKEQIFKINSLKKLEKFETDFNKYIAELNESEFKDILDDSAEDFGRILEIIYLLKKE